MESLMELVRSIRNIRAERKVPPAQRISIRIVTDQPQRFDGAEAYLGRLAGVEKAEISPEKGEVKPSDVHIVFTGAEAYIPLASLVDIPKEKERVEKEIQRVQGEIARANGKLSNERFVSKAPEAVVAEERRKLAVAEDMLLKLQERQSTLAQL